MHWDRAKAKTRSAGRSGSTNLQALLRVAGVAAIGLTVANCSSNVRVDPKYGVPASPKVVADGEAVPKGGGRELVGRPYVVGGRTYVPTENPRPMEGLASWYGPGFHGRMTANGEIFDRNSIAAAHTTMPLPSYARVTNLNNGHSMIVRVNDRGPFHANRVIDVSERAASVLGFKTAGTARVRVEYIGRASTNGSDDRILLASLRTDGQPASLGGATSTLVAQATPRPSEPRQTVAARNVEPSGAQPAAIAAPVGPAQQGSITLAQNVPLPPERPFDLGTIPGASSPLPRVSALSPNVTPSSRPVLAGLYYASPTGSERGFHKTDGFAPLDQSKFVLR